MTPKVDRISRATTVLVQLSPPSVLRLSIRPSRRCCASLSLGGRPGEIRTFKAAAPPRRRASRHRITELGAHPIVRPTSFRDRPWSSRRNARQRRASSSSAGPLGRTVLSAFSAILHVPFLEQDACLDGTTVPARRSMRATALARRDLAESPQRPPRTEMTSSTPVTETLSENPGTTYKRTKATRARIEGVS